MANVTKAREGTALLEIAKGHINRDRTNEAVKVATEALVIFREVADEDGKEAALMLIVKAHIKAGQTAVALEAAKEALQLYTNMNDSKGKGSAMRALSMVLLEQEDYAEALGKAQDMLKLSESEKYEKGKAGALQTMMAVFEARSETTELLKTAQEVLNIQQKLDDKISVAATLLKMTQVLCGKADQTSEEGDEGVKKGLEAKKIYKEMGNMMGELSVFTAFVDKHLLKGDKDAALKAAKEAVSLCKTESDKMSTSMAFRLKSKVHVAREEPEAALKAATKALQLVKEAGSVTADVQSEADCLYSVMSAHMAKDQAQKAVDTAGEVVSLFNIDRSKRAGAMVRLSEILIGYGNPDDALQVAGEAREIYKELGDSRGEGAVLMGSIAESQLMKGDVGEALASAENALSLAQDQGRKLGQAMAHRMIARIQESAQETGPAMESLKQVVSCFTEMGGGRLAAEARLSLVRMQLTAGAKEKALENAKEAQTWFQKAGEKRAEVTAMEAMTEVHMAMEKKDEAQKTAEAAKAILASLGDTRAAATASQAVTSIRLAKKEFKEVLKAAKDELDKAKKSGDKRELGMQHLTIANTRIEQAQDNCADLQKLMISKAKSKQEQKAVPTRRLMEALMAAKEALVLFQDVGDGHFEAVALQTLANIYRFKCEPMLAIDSAKQATAIFKAMSNRIAAAGCLMLEATTYLMIVGQQAELPDTSGGSRVVIPQEEAHSAASEAQQIYIEAQDRDGEDYARRVIDAAQNILDQVAKGDNDEDDLYDLIDPTQGGDRDILDGFAARARAEKKAPTEDPRLRGRKLKSDDQSTVAPHPVMDKLMAACTAARQTVR
mmetsp:Transcript_102634/g.219521  ORF Transcript_102634/g.219521 Transcript_102634/m.219521 type:complete len:838 (-) Transcript_102634:122-2635(-)